jgi:hypothetical protein
MDKEAEIVGDVRKVGLALGKVPGRDRFGKREYITAGGRFSQYYLYDGGRGWEFYCRKAGYEPKTKSGVSDPDYAERFRRACGELGRPPRKSEYKNYGLSCNKRRRGDIHQLYATIASEIFGRRPATATPAAAEKGEAPPDTSREARKSENVQNTHIGRTRRHVPPIPKNIRGKKWEQIGIDGFPYAPHHEMGVVAIFAILCSRGRLPLQITYVTSGTGTDGVCWDEEAQEEVRVEFKKILAKSSFDKSLGSFDMLVCWENRWPDFPKRVIELKGFVS